MNTFTIRDIENLSGIKAHTLRVWEQRYGIIRPMRKDSNHRLYGIDDLKQILRISLLYNQGYKISRIAEMTEPEINSLSLEFMQKGHYEVFVNQMMEASIDFDEPAFRNALDGAIFHLGLEKAMLQAVYPFLNKVGILWLTGNVIPAQEHFASAIIRNRIIAAMGKITPRSKRSGLRFILFCPPAEFHEIPLLMVQYSLKFRGIPCVLFGVDTNLDQLKAYTEKFPATHLITHLITNFTNQSPQEILDELVNAFPGVNIIASGKSFREVKAKGDQIKLMGNANEFYNYLNTI